MNNYKIVSKPTSSTLGLALCHDADVELGVFAYEHDCTRADAFDGIIDSLSSELTPALTAYLKFFNPAVVATLLFEYDRALEQAKRIATLEDTLKDEVQGLTLAEDEG